MAFTVGNVAGLITTQNGPIVGCFYRNAFSDGDTIIQSTNPFRSFVFGGKSAILSHDGFVYNCTFVTFYFPILSYMDDDDVALHHAYLDALDGEIAIHQTPDRDHRSRSTQCRKQTISPSLDVFWTHFASSASFEYLREYFNCV